jgi:hypothetical protein
MDVKKLVTLLLLVGIIVTMLLSLADYEKLVTVKEGNIEKKPLDIAISKTQDADCGMIIESLKFSSQVVAPDGKTWFFHDIGGMVNWMKDKSFKDDLVIWVYSMDTNRWCDGYKAYYSTTDTTPMNNGFGAYEQYKDGLISFDDMRLKMLRGETLNNPAIRKKLFKDANN